MAKTRHATDHQNGGTDEIDVTGLTGAGAAAHATSHQNGGADEISIAGLDGTPVELTNHLNDATDAHDASAISFTPTGTIAATDVQAAIAEVASEAAGGHAEDHDHDGAPTQKLAQANTHETPDTDAGPTSLHHTLGTGANQAAAGDHAQPGTELDYVAFTSDVNITATTEATANAVVTGNGVAYDGSTAVIIEFFCPGARPALASNAILLLYITDGGTSIGRIATIAQPTYIPSGAVGVLVPVYARFRLTPSAASHTYGITARVGSGTGVVSAGAGGNAAIMPGFIRITRA